MFFDYVRQGRATRHYAREHAEYLVEAVDRSLKELQKLTPGQGMDTALYECEAQLAMLQSELSSIRNGADDNALAAARQKIAGIRDRLEKANSQL